MTFFQSEVARPKEALATQIVVCPKCQTKYRLNGAVPDQGLILSCSVCQSKLVIQPPAPAGAGEATEGVKTLDPSQANPPPQPLSSKSSALVLGNQSTFAAVKGDDSVEGPDNSLSSVNPPASLVESKEVISFSPSLKELSREVICPSCLQPLIATLAVGQDSWLNCPHCGEKFLAPANPALVSLNAAPLAKGFKPAKAKKRLVLKVDSLGQLYEIGVLDQSLSQKRRIALALIVVVAIGLGLYGLLLVASWREAHNLSAPTLPPEVIAPIAAYDDGDFRQDLYSFSRWSRGKFLSNFEIDYSGYSSRLFKYAIKKLAPKDCQEFTSLTLNALDQGGVKITGHCYQTRLANPTILVNWRGREAILTTPESSEIITVELYPKAQFFKS
ncbi:MAG: zinc-ribbon domain-containing protein [Deltaproteobacteria bacterium]|jgi:hypothetical protein|nr:zinc-ribbon domain-containing protein [Deltaproteobacteria bacterium]